MKLLLDTSVLLWIIFEERKKLSAKALEALNASEEVLLSVVSIWEISIKYSIGKLKLKENPKKWIPSLIPQLGFQILPVLETHALTILDLPLHHRDPFDRLLIAQSKSENIPLISSDGIFKEYDVECVW
ncbi:MAG: type II toxin-antitoxin system VapC family toxin [Deltaproteobacteria bacterium]|nr:type II toxin-antitoxin system VapC family toxin [Deltaproteobacteria bacterium]